MRPVVTGKARRICGALWGFAWLAVAALLLLPLPVTGPERSDLLAHFLLFGGMALGTVSFSRRPGQLVGLTLLTIAGATALEAAQGLFPHRSFDPADLAANALGATAGFALALIVLWLWPGPADRARTARI